MYLQIYTWWHGQQVKFFYEIWDLEKKRRLNYDALEPIENIDHEEAYYQKALRAAGYFFMPGDKFLGYVPCCASLKADPLVVIIARLKAGDLCFYAQNINTCRFNSLSFAPNKVITLDI